MMPNASFTNFYLLVFLFYFPLKITICQDDYSTLKCNDNLDSLTNEQCFNNVLKFENYQVNHFARNSNGDVVVEFTKYAENNEISSSRKFYVLQYDGHYFLIDEPIRAKEFDININVDTIDENQKVGLDVSKNLFVTIKNSDTFFFDRKKL